MDTFTRKVTIGLLIGILAVFLVFASEEIVVPVDKRISTKVVESCVIVHDYSNSRIFVETTKDEYLELEIRSAEVFIKGLTSLSEYSFPPDDDCKKSKIRTLVYNQFTNELIEIR